MNITVSVTQDDIDKGDPCNAYSCPIWHALSRALPRLTERGDADFTVGPLGLWSNACIGRIDLPEAVYRFMARFDDGVPVKPFSFVLDVPDEFIPAGVS